MSSYIIIFTANSVPLILPMNSTLVTVDTMYVTVNEPFYMKLEYLNLDENIGDTYTVSVENLPSNAYFDNVTGDFNWTAVDMNDVSNLRYDIF